MVYEFDRSTKCLTIKQLDIPEMQCNIIQETKDSYKKYLNETIYDDLEYLCDKIAEVLNFGAAGIHVDSVTKKPMVFIPDEPIEANYAPEKRLQKNKYYPVEVVFSMLGWIVGPVRVFRIPYMDNDGNLNFDGRRNVVLQELRNLECVTYDDKKETLNITLNNVNIAIIKQTSGFAVKAGKRKIPIADVITAMFSEAGDKSFRLIDVIANGYLKRTLKLDPLQVMSTSDDVVGKIGLLDMYKKPHYKLGDTRTALNECFDLNKLLVGETLSRQTLSYPEGTVITEDMVREFKRAGLNIFYVKDIPDITGLYYADSMPIYIRNKIEKGTKNCRILRELFPEHAGEIVFESDAYLPEGHIAEIVHQGSVITEDIAEYFSVIGMEDLVLASTKSMGGGAIQVYRYEREVVGNFTTKLGDIVDSIPNGKSYDDWVCYEGLNSEMSATAWSYTACIPESYEYITRWDFLAALSMFGHMCATGENPFLNRDREFLHSVNLVNETFSRYFRKATDLFVKTYAQAINAFLNGNKMTLMDFNANKGNSRISNNAGNNPFDKLYHEWKHMMWEDSILRGSEMVNTIAKYTQTSRIVTLAGRSAGKKTEVANDQRLLSLGHYGRIDPYETPAGKKLGLFNTRAIGSRVEDRQLLTPYRRVVATSEGKYFVAKKIEYLSAKDEMTEVIGDIQDLDLDENWFIKSNKIVKARVPNHSIIGDRVLIDYIESYRLNYVNAYPEQHLAPSTMLIPFFGANDSIRGSFAAGQLRQGITQYKPEISRVMTPFYKGIYEEENEYVIRAKEDGIVTVVTTNLIVINGASGEITYDIKETIITSQSAIFLNYRVKMFDRVKAGDILVDSSMSKDGFLCLGANALVAYMFNRYNYEDAVVISDEFSKRTRSYKPVVEEYSIQAGATVTTSVGPARGFRYVSKGMPITTYQISGTDGGIVNRKINSKKESGLFFHVESRLNTDKRTKLCRAYMLKISDTTTGDKFTGRHGNKGVTSYITPNSQMPRLMNGKTIDVTLTPAGVPSRMNMGTLLELKAGLAAEVLNIRIISPPFNGATTGDVKRLVEFAYDLANSDNFENVFKNYSWLPQELFDYLREPATVQHIKEWEGCFNRDGTARLWNPETQDYFEFPILIGVANFVKLEQEADTKESSRGCCLDRDIEYSSITKQPTKGSPNGGIRFSEMDIYSYAAHGAAHLMREVLNERSDNHELKYDDMLNKLGLKTKSDLGKSWATSTYQFLYYMEVLGLKVDCRDLPDVTMSAVKDKTLPNLNVMLHSYLRQQAEEDRKLEEQTKNYAEYIKQKRKERK